jgi:predicted GH43/DUF377 family glycosyl hydrolase
VLHDNTYYLFYTAYNGLPELALATCPANSDPRIKKNWKLHGKVFPKRPGWCKSATLYIPNNDTSYLFYHEIGRIYVASTSDFINYKELNKTLLEYRPDKFDSFIVETGPEPLQLSDGNFLFLYNSAAEEIIPNKRPNWKTIYRLGFIILDKNNPLNILYRSEQPILSPLLPWEKCDNSAGKYADVGLSPDVIFANGWKKTGVDKFLLTYQGCDTFIGLAEVTVSF